MRQYKGVRQRKEEQLAVRSGSGCGAWTMLVLEALALFCVASYVIPITNYQMAPSKRGAGGGSATHKEPT